MNAGSLDLFICPECSASGLQLEPYCSNGSEVSEGRVLCTACETWYRIENGILDLLPLHLRRKEFYQLFSSKHGLRINELRGKDRQSDSISSKQIEFFRRSADDYEKTIVNLPYYQALHHMTFVNWMKTWLKPGDRILDIGCGTGRQSIPFAQYGLISCGIDISEEMLRLARKKVQALNLEGVVELVVGDAHNPPVKDYVFRACIMYGTLHHLSQPDMAVINASKKIGSGGFFYTLDPHKSPIRFIFDWMMKIWTLYDAKANEELISEDKLMQWLQTAGIQGKTRLSTYLPPHFFRPTSLTSNVVVVLKVTNSIFHRIPGIRKWGGMVISEGTKIS